MISSTALIMLLSEDECVSQIAEKDMKDIEDAQGEK